MSVLIKDMAIPTSCTMCWLNTFCGVWNTEPVKHKGFNERLEGCPLTELILCKDCRYFTGKWCKRDTIQVIADLKDRLLMKYAWVSENDYCSRAERRGEE